MALFIARCNSDHPDFVALYQKLDAENVTRYGPLPSFHTQLNKVEGLATVVIVYDGQEAIGCGCFRPMNDRECELKRMFVRPSHRGTTVATMILSELEVWAAASGFRKMLLRTGNRQPEAIRFYQRMGYSSIPPFGQYIGDPQSVCMDKSL